MILIAREETVPSSLTRRIIADSRLTTHQYRRPAANFSDITGKVTFLVSYHRRARTIEKIRKELLLSLFSIFILYHSFATSSTSTSLHGELSTSVSWEHRFVSFPSRFHAIVVSTDRYRREFVHFPFCSSYHSSPALLLEGKVAEFRIEWKTQGRPSKFESRSKNRIKPSSDGKLSSGNW